MRWTWLTACVESDFVNCAFGSDGPCRNPKHKDKTKESR